MFGNVGKCPGCGFLDSWIKFLKTDNQGLKGSRVNHCLSELGGVLGDSSKNKGCSFLVESILLIEGHDQLGEDLVVDHTLCQLLVHVGKPAESECGALRDGWNIVKQEWPQKTHDSG